MRKSILTLALILLLASPVFGQPALGEYEGPEGTEEIYSATLRTGMVIVVVAKNDHVRLDFSTGGHAFFYSEYGKSVAATLGSASLAGNLGTTLVVVNGLVQAIRIDNQ